MQRPSLSASSDGSLLSPLKPDQAYLSRRRGGIVYGALADGNNIAELRCV